MKKFSTIIPRIVITIIEIYLLILLIGDNSPLGVINGNLKILLTGFLGFSITVSCYLIYTSFVSTKTQNGYSDIIDSLDQKYEVMNSTIERELLQLKQEFKNSQNDELVSRDKMEQLSKAINYLEKLKIENSKNRVGEVMNSMHSKTTIANNR